MPYSQTPQTAQSLRAGLSNFIINPLIALLFMAALLVFIWGLVEFMWGLSSGSERKEQGKMHMLWGIIGLVVMTVAYTLVQLAANFLGASLPG